MKIIVLVTLALCFQIAQAQPVELTFKDLRLGVSTLVDFEAVFPGATCHKKGDRFGPVTWDDSGCVWTKIETAQGIQYGGYPVLNFVLCSVDSNGKIVMIHANLDEPTNYESILAAMAEKFGPAHIRVTEVQNMMGVKFDQKFAVWHSKGSSLVYTKHSSSDLTISSLTLTSDAKLAADNKAVKQHIKDAAKSGL